MIYPEAKYNFSDIMLNFGGGFAEVGSINRTYLEM
jgi:hypothetical protein